MQSGSLCGLSELCVVRETDVGSGTPPPTKGVARPLGFFRKNERMRDSMRPNPSRRKIGARHGKDPFWITPGRQWRSIARKQFLRSRHGVASKAGNVSPGVCEEASRPMHAQQAGFVNAEFAKNGELIALRARRALRCSGNGCWNGDSAPRQRLDRAFLVRPAAAEPSVS